VNFSDVDRGAVLCTVTATRCTVTSPNYYLFLLLHRCDAEHFLDDLGLDSIPEGDWFCAPCVEKKEKESVAVSSVKTSVKAAKGSTPSKSKAEVTEVEVCVKASASRKRVAETVEPTSALEGRRSARRH
jgi:hypothetical protein